MLSRIRLADALLFSLFVFDRVMLAPGLPAGVALAALLVALAVVRPARFRITNLGPIILLMVLLVCHLAVVSELNGQDWRQRLLRIALLFALTVIVAQGRYDWFSAICGMVFSALVINIPAYYLGLTSDIYPPFLTGFFGDKNVAGLWYVVLACLGLYVVRRPSYRVIWLSGMLGVILLTGSRTSLAALGVAIIILVLRNRLAWPLRLLVAGVVVMILNLIEESYARVWIFTNRVGTDWYRDQIDAIVDAKLAATPWYGQGLTTASVTIWDHEAFFHNSFKALVVEGGYILLIGILVLYGIALGVANFRQAVDADTLIGEMAIAVILVCAWKLGEVFFSSPAAIALGFALMARLGVRIAAPGVKGVSPEVGRLLAREPLPPTRPAQAAPR